MLPGRLDLKKKIERFNTQVKQIEAACNKVVEFIGYDTSAGSQDIKALGAYHVSNIHAVLPDKKGVPQEIEFKTKSGSSDKATFVNLGSKTYFYSESLGIAGLNRHSCNSNIYMMVEPTGGYRHKALTEIQLKLATMSSEDATVLRRNEKRYWDFCEPIQQKYAVRYLRDVVNKIHEETHKPVTIIVLGKNDEKNENVAIYQLLAWKKKELPGRHNLDCYRLSKQKVNKMLLEATAKDESIQDHMIASVDIVHIDTPKRDDCKTNINYQDLDYLYELYSHTLARERPKPLLIHCKEGYDRTGKLTYALYALSRMESLLQFINVEQTVEAFVGYLEALRSSRSPGALSVIDDFKEAIYLSYALEGIALQKQALQELKAYLKDEPNKKFNKIVHKLEDKSETIQENMQRIEQLKADLSTVDKSAKIQSLIDNLYNAYDASLSMQTKYLEIANPSYLDATRASKGEIETIILSETALESSRHLPSSHG